MRIVQMARQLMEECRANKALDERTIAVHTTSPSLQGARSAHVQRPRLAPAYKAPCLVQATRQWFNTAKVHHILISALLCRLLYNGVLALCAQKALICRQGKLNLCALQAHLLRIVDPMTGQPLTMDRIEDEASILFIAGACLPALMSSQCKLRNS